MSFSYWRYYSKTIGRALSGVFGFIALAGAISFVWMFWPDPPPTHIAVDIGSEAAYLAKTLDDDCRALLAAKPEPDPTPKQTEDCADKAEAQKYNYASLAQAIRSANATVYAAYIGYVQTCIGIIGALLVTATLIASAGATFAAYNAARGTIDAAIATRDSVRLALRTFAITHRPRLRVRKVYAACVDGEEIKINAEIANVGDMGATLQSASMILQVGTKDSTSQTIIHDAASTRGTIYYIEGGGHLLLSLQMHLRYGSDKNVRWDIMSVHGEVIYRDHFAGDEFDIEEKMNFKSTPRKTAFERFQHTRDPNGR